MCGIAGCIVFNGSVDTAAVERMGQALAHRGPDGNWTWQQPDGSAAFAYRRLAIIDPEHCLFHPFVWQNRFLVLYNGEIYNYKTLRAELEQLGYSFRSTSDAEVLPALYDCYGADCLKKIDGMFSFALWDIESKELFCARDRFGEKPFFYSIVDGKFFFASEIKALRVAGVEVNTDSRMLFNYLAYNLVEYPDDFSQTFYGNVKRLPPATWLKIKRNGDAEQRTYWQLPKQPTTKALPFAETVERFVTLLTESVKRRLQADTDVGCNVSGGLDSSAVFSIVKELRGADTVHTFTARIRDKALDEGPYVDTLLQHLPAKNHEAWVDEGVLIQSLDTVLAQQEEPISDLTILAQAELMKRASAEKIKVLLDGQGADEMLAGYDYFYHPYLREQFHDGVKPYRDALVDYREKHGASYRLDAVFYFDLLAPRLRRTLSTARRTLITPPYLRYLHPSFANAYRRAEPPFPRFDTLRESLHYRTTRYGMHKLLRYADRNGMAHGIEVRFPFLYHELVEFVFSLPKEYKIYHGWTKYVLRKAMEHKLPPSIDWRTNKLGYNVPVKTWLEHPKVIEMVRDAQGMLAQQKIVRPDVKLSQSEALAVLIASRFVK